MANIYYNENEPFAVRWLKQLIIGNFLPDGDIDERSIEDVKPAEIKDYKQCHFFAGIGGWPYALKLAEWPTDRPVWTGSCPCQPFSSAGKRKGFADERHLWPTWFHLIQNVQPVTIFGEQVASAKEWLDLVFDDLEGTNYSVGAVVLPACSVGAPHKRSRIWFVANSESAGWSFQYSQNERRSNGEINASTNASNLTSSLANGDGRRRPREKPEPIVRHSIFWNNAIELECRDGKKRLASPEPALFPLAYGIPGRVGLLRGAGNAIVPQVAAEVIKCFL